MVKINPISNNLIDNTRRNFMSYAASDIFFALRDWDGNDHATSNTPPWKNTKYGSFIEHWILTRTSQTTLSTNKAGQCKKLMVLLCFTAPKSYYPLLWRSDRERAIERLLNRILFEWQTKNINSGIQIHF